MGSITEAVEAARPIYQLGRHHGYRDALDDLAAAVEIGEIVAGPTLTKWLEDVRKAVQHER